MILLRVTLGLTLGTGLFVAGWWTGQKTRTANPRQFAEAVSIASQAASTAPGAHLSSASEALAGFARGERTHSRRELATLLHDAPAAEIPALLDIVVKLPSRLDRGRFRTALLSRWVTLDPDGARRWAEARPNLEDRHEAVRDVLSTWAQTAPAAVAALIRSVDGREDIETLDALLSNWVASDLTSAKAWVSGIKNPRLRDAASRSLVTTMAEQDPTAAFETALALLPDHGARDAVGIAARALVLSDPSAAASVLKRIPAGDAKNDAAVEIVSAMSASAPQLAADFALTLPAGNSRQAALAAAISTLATDPDAAFNWIETAIPAGPERTQATENVVRAIAESSPAAAAQRLDLLPPDSRATMAGWLAQQWAESDAAGASTWARQLPAGPERDNAIKSLLSVRFQRDPVGALKEYQQEFSDLTPDQLMAMVHQTPRIFSGFGLSSGGISSEQLVALLPFLPSDETRKQFLATALWHQSMDSPEATAALLTTLPAAQRPDDAFSSVAGRWADLSPTSAAAWAAALPDPAARHAACAAVLTSWGRTDPDATARWACSLADERLRQTAAEQTAGSWAANDPVAATQWMARLGDAKFRAAATEAIARTWLYLDFETAAAWLATTELPPERKAALLQKGRR